MIEDEKAASDAKSKKKKKKKKLPNQSRWRVGRSSGGKSGGAGAAGAAGAAGGGGHDGFGANEFDSQDEGDGDNTSLRSTSSAFSISSYSSAAGKSDTAPCNKLHHAMNCTANWHAVHVYLPLLQFFLHTKSTLSCKTCRSNTKFLPNSPHYDVTSFPCAREEQGAARQAIVIGPSVAG